MSGSPNISSAIAQLREELTKAIEEGEGKTLRFLPKSVVIELNLVFKAEGSSGVKVGGIWSVLEFSAAGKISNENTHKVTLTLEPKQISDPSIRGIGFDVSTETTSTPLLKRTPNKTNIAKSRRG